MACRNDAYAFWGDYSGDIPVLSLSRHISFFALSWGLKAVGVPPVHFATLLDTMRGFVASLPSFRRVNVDLDDRTVSAFLIEGQTILQQIIIFYLGAE